MQKNISRELPVFALFLMAALMSVFAHMDRAQGFLSQHHGYLSSHGMALMANLSTEHPGLMFTSKWQDSQGGIHYDLYNRFPPGAFFITRALVWPWTQSASGRLFGAMVVMKLFFMASALLAFVSLFRLTGNAAASFCATALSYASLYLLYYNDMVFNDIPTLFGCMLTFHGMVVYMKEMRLGQLLVKAMAGMFLGWQVGTLAGAFAIGLMIRQGMTRPSLRSAVTGTGAILGGSVLGFGLLLFAFNLWGEHLATGLGVAQLPSFQRMLWRLGLAGAQDYAAHMETLSAGGFALDQLNKIGRMLVPAIIIPGAQWSGVFSLAGLGTLAAALWLGARSRNRLLWLSLVGMGIIWAALMRHFVAFHDFQSMFYIGIPLVVIFHAAQFLLARAPRLVPVVTLAVAIVFAASCLHLNHIKYETTCRANDSEVADFQQIATVAGPGSRVFVDGNCAMFNCQRYEIEYYLAGRYLQKQALQAQYLISPRAIAGVLPLIPDTSRVFVYRISAKDGM